GPDAIGEQHLEAGDARARREPSGSQRRDHLRDLGLADRRPSEGQELLARDGHRGESGASHTIRSPRLGRRVRPASATTSWPGGSVSRWREAMLASIVTTCVMASVSPMQTCDPPPKGKYE